MNKSQRGNELRPLSFDDFVGQSTIVEELKILIKASKIRKTQIQHILFSGPPGLGKTTLASIVATEKGTQIFITSAPAIEKPADLACMLLELKYGDILFIDEIHGLNSKVEESLYSALEDFKFYISVENGGQSKLICLDLEPFTLIGATTKPSLLSSPMRTRLSIQHTLEFYSNKELSLIIKRAATIIDIKIEDAAALEIAKRSRNTARIANNLLGRVSAYAIVANKSISYKLACSSMKKMKIDKCGLSSSDRKYMQFLLFSLNNSPAGVKTISSYIAEDERTLEYIIEPFLIQKGFLSKTKRGRMLTKKGVSYTKTEIKNK